VLSRTELPELEAGFIALIMGTEGNKVGLRGMSSRWLILVTNIEW
jgi:hypothetical protein